MLLAALIATIPKVWAKTPVALELVLAVDVSTSVDASEFELQRQGLANAFLHRDVLNAIYAVGEGGIAVSVVYWAGSSQQVTIVDWMVVRDELSAATMAQKIFTASRSFSGLTDISGAIVYSTASIENNGYLGQRRAIDISGDGFSDARRDAAARNIAVALDITINGLIIFSKDVDLMDLANIAIRNHFANHVIGGEGAFMMSARDFEDFHIAIRRKLVREIFGPNIAALKPQR